MILWTKSTTIVTVENFEMQLSIVIPTHNEALNLPKLVDRLRAGCHTCQIIVVDAQSIDGTEQLARDLKLEVYRSSRLSRAHQMNLGASKATSDVLYFVHADTLPPVDFQNDIKIAMEEGYEMGCYRFRFAGSRFLLRINSYFTRFQFLWCRGGDQSLFVTKRLYEQLNGFSEEFVIMEEYEFLQRAMQQTALKIIPKDVVVSPRKYENNSYLRVQLANLVVFNMFRFGVSPLRIRDTYRRLLRYRS